MGFTPQTIGFYKIQFYGSYVNTGLGLNVKNTLAPKLLIKQTIVLSPIFDLQQ